jgi:hypothetical protein
VNAYTLTFGGVCCWAVGWPTCARHLGRGGGRRRRRRGAAGRDPDQRAELALGFLVGAGFAVAGAILAAVLISSRDSHEHSEAARSGEAAGADAAAVPVVAG